MSTPTYRVLRNMIVQLPARAGFVPIVCSLQMPTFSSIEIDDNDTFSRVGSTFASAMIAVDALTAVTRYMPGMQIPIGQCDELVRLIFPLREGEAVPGRLEWRGHLASVIGPKAATGTFAVSGFKITVANRPCWIPGLPPAAQPQNLTATAGISDITLTWSASVGATAYQIFRGTSSGGESSTPVATVSGTSYVDAGIDASTTYYYFVVAVNSGSRSEPSAEASTLSPPYPSGLIGQYEPDSLVISGSTITAWNDKSGSGYNLPAVGTVNLTAINGFNAATGFAGTGARFTGTGPSLDPTVGWTMFAVVRPESPGPLRSSAVWAGGTTSGTPAGALWVGYHTQSLCIWSDYFINGDSALTPANTPPNAVNVLSGRMEGDFALTIQQNADSVGTGAYTGPSNATETILSIGCSNSGDTDFSMNGSIIAIFIFGRALSDSEITQVRSRLNGKFLGV